MSPVKVTKVHVKVTKVPVTFVISPIKVTAINHHKGKGS